MSIEHIYTSSMHRDSFLSHIDRAFQLILCWSAAADWDRVLSVNVKGYSFMLKHAARLMKKNHGNNQDTSGGSIINIASISGWIGQPAFGPYSASKVGGNS